MSSRDLPGMEYFDRADRWFQDQLQYWKDVRAQVNKNAKRILGPDEYHLKDLLKDSLDLWGKSLAASEAAVAFPMQMSGDERTPVIGFRVRLGDAGAGPKTVRIPPVDDETLVSTHLLGLHEGKVDKKKIRTRIIRRGLLEVGLQDMASQEAPPDYDVKEGQYLGMIRNSDVPLAAIHLVVIGKHSDRPAAPP